MSVFKKLIVYKNSKKGHSSPTHFTYLCIHSSDVECLPWARYQCRYWTDRNRLYLTLFRAHGLSTKAGIITEITECFTTLWQVLWKRDTEHSERYPRSWTWSGRAKTAFPRKWLLILLVNKGHSTRRNNIFWLQRELKKLKVLVAKARTARGR